MSGWTPDRLQQLERLQDLLRIASESPRSTVWMQHVTEAAEIADELRRGDLATGKHSFLTFLIKQAHDKNTRR